MQENYIQIFTSYLGYLVENREMNPSDAVGLVKVFQPAAPYVDSRERLIKFLDKYIEVYPKLDILKQRLLDSNYKF